MRRLFTFLAGFCIGGGAMGWMMAVMLKSAFETGVALVFTAGAIVFLVLKAAADQATP